MNKSVVETVSSNALLARLYELNSQIATVQFGSCAFAQGTLVSTNGNYATVRDGSRFYTGTLVH